MTDLFAADPGRVFTVPPGVDFAAAVLHGLDSRLSGQPPEAAARVTIYVNTERTQRRLVELLHAGPARLMPRIRVLTDILRLPEVAHLPPHQPALDMRLHLMSALDRVCAAAPDIAPRTALQDLSESLAALLEEMAGERVDPAALAGLDMGAHAAHWQKSRALLEAMAAYALDPGTPPGQEGALRRAVDTLVDLWADQAPRDPILVAGSTASRGATRRFMELVTRLPQGAVILPGVDTALPGALWPALARRGAEDHPQARFAAFLSGLGIGIDETSAWSPAQPAVPARNQLVSLALRPAPVTDQWLQDGPGMTPLLAAATRGLSLIEAPGRLEEAEAIALALRCAVEDNRRAALITPDRDLARQVTAALDRWRISPDDSAGMPLNQSAPGRLLREAAAVQAASATLPAVLTLLKHPLTCTGSAVVTRGQHLMWTRGLELHLRRQQHRTPDPHSLLKWAEGSADRHRWAHWVIEAVLAPPEQVPGARVPLSDRIAALRARSAAICGGPDATGPGALWEREAGEKAAQVLCALNDAAAAAPPLDAFDFDRLLTALLSGEEVRRAPGNHPQVAILGTLEARMQSADLVILGGLNDGTWPERPGPDPWLSRKMRADLGLLSPERQVGLSAHDFQQAIAGADVILSRALRDAEAETVPSRWLNRMLNLLGGLGEEGKNALAGMRARGERWRDDAARLDGAAIATLPPARAAGLAAAPRPAPRPPVALRPTRLSVTEITTLIRDPYAIYARHVLRLKPLDPLLPTADARLRGNVLHDAIARVIAAGTPLPQDGSAPEKLRAAMIAELQSHDVDPAIAALWQARFEAILPGFIAREAPRAEQGVPLLVEERKRLDLPTLPITLTAQPDRIDRLTDGTFAVYDYKTTLKSLREVAAFEKQLPLQAAMLEANAFSDVTGTGDLKVSVMGYIGVGSQDEDRMIPRVDKAGTDLVEETWDGLERLLTGYQARTQGYRARAAAHSIRFAGSYDQLARFGEWSDADPFAPEDVG